MFLSGDCHSFPDTKACGFQDSQRQAILLAFLFLFFYPRSRGNSREVFSPFVFGIADSSLIHKMGRGRGSPEPMTRMEPSGPASVFNTYEPQMPPVLTPSIVSASHTVVLCTGAPTHMALWLTLELTVAQPTGSLVLSSQAWSLGLPLKNVEVRTQLPELEGIGRAELSTVVKGDLGLPASLSSAGLKIQLYGAKAACKY